MELVGATSGYGNVSILRGVDLSVLPQQFVALVGPNGSGKTTLLKTLLGRVPLRSGSARIFGAAPSKLDKKWRLGYVPQRVVIDEHLPATVEEVVSLGRLHRRKSFRPQSAGDQAAIDHAIEVVAMAEHRTRKLYELSGGQQQRVLIAKALAGEPELLVLDEPVAGVDAESQNRFRETLAHFRDSGGSILLVSHELGAVAQDLDRIVVLRQGAVVFDGPTDELVDRGVSLGVHDSDLPMWLEGL